MKHCGGWKGRFLWGLQGFLLKMACRRNTIGPAMGSKRDDGDGDGVAEG